MRTAAALFAVLSVIFLISHLHHTNHYSFVCFITFLTCFYHFGYRLVVYSAVTKSKIKVNSSNTWFTPKSFEKKLYKSLRIKHNREKLTKFFSQASPSRNITEEELIEHTCRSEIVYEINIVLSFVPFIVSLFSSLYSWIFLVTGIITAMFDLFFIVFNRRFRLKLLKRIGSSKKTTKKQK